VDSILSLSSRRRFRHALLWVPVAVYMAVIFYLSAQHDPLPVLTALVWDKALHFVEYVGLAVLLERAFFGEGMPLGRAFLAAVFAASLYAASDEIHQMWVQGRDPAVLDWLAGSIGAVGGAAVYLAAVRFGGPRIARL
jgi:VanZ family protein